MTWPSGEGVWFYVTCQCWPYSDVLSQGMNDILLIGSSQKSLPVLGVGWTVLMQDQLGDPHIKVYSLKLLHSASQWSLFDNDSEANYHNNYQWNACYSGAGWNSLPGRSKKSTWRTAPCFNLDIIWFIKQLQFQLMAPSLEQYILLLPSQ